MVRKWSYIENISNCYKVNPRFNMRRLSKKHSFKVFRKTTRFKKYRLGITKFVRKFYARKRRRTSLYMNSHILYSWIHHYLRHRQFIRFTQSFGLVHTQGYLGSADFSIKNSLFVGSEYGFHSYSCSKRVLNKSTFFKNNIFNDKSISFDSRNSFIQFTDVDAANNSNDLGTNVLIFDKLCYPLHLENQNTDNYTKILNNMECSIFEISTSIIIEINKTIVLLTLLNSHKIVKLWN
jgi:hypothetical protein